MYYKIKSIYKTFLNGWKIKDGFWKKFENNRKINSACRFGNYVIDDFLINYIVDKKSLQPKKAL